MNDILYYIILHYKAPDDAGAEGEGAGLRRDEEGQRVVEHLRSVAFLKFYNWDQIFNCILY